MTVRMNNSMKGFLPSRAQQSELDPSQISGGKTSQTGQATQTGQTTQVDQTNPADHVKGCGDGFVPVDTKPKTRAPTIENADVVKEYDHVVVVTLRPPAPVVTYRDPLLVSGKAEPGAMVTLYQRSRPGRPVLDTVKADKNGDYSFKITDDTLFNYGDQISVSSTEKGKSASKHTLIETEPFEKNNIKTIYRREGSVVREENRTELIALDKDFDLVAPFWDDGKIAPQLTRGRGGCSLQLKGDVDAVEPHSTISYTRAGQEHTVQADAEGRFALNVDGIPPGGALHLTVQDINGRTLDVPVQTEDLRFDVDALTRGSSISQTRPKTLPSVEQGGSVDDDPAAKGPWLKLRAKNVAEPGAEVAIRNQRTGDVHLAQVDKKGVLRTDVPGVSPLDVLEFGVRIPGKDDNAPSLRGGSLHAFVAGGSQLMPMDAFSKTEGVHDLAGAFAAIAGPPVNKMVDGKPDPDGPFLKFDPIEGLPPFGQLVIERDGKEVARLDIDEDGKSMGNLLPGCEVHEHFDVRVQDALGRDFPSELRDCRVPSAGETIEVGATNTNAGALTLKELGSVLGKGTLEPFFPKQTGKFFYDFGDNMAGRWGLEASEHRGDDDVRFHGFLPKGLVPENLGKGAFGGQGLEAGVYDHSKKDAGDRPGKSLIATAEFVGNHRNANHRSSRVQFTDGKAGGSFKDVAEGAEAALAAVEAAQIAGMGPGDVGFDCALNAAKLYLVAVDQLGSGAADENKETFDALRDRIGQMQAEGPGGGFAPRGNESTAIRGLHESQQTKDFWSDVNVAIAPKRDVGNGWNAGGITARRQASPMLSTFFQGRRS